MKKRKIILYFLVLLAISIFFVGCKKTDDTEKLTHYIIDAEYDEANKTIDAKMNVEYVNSSNAILDEVCFHLYPSAYRENARFTAISEDRITSAYPNGTSFGGIEVSSLSVNGESAEIVINGQDEDILVVALKKMLEPTQTVEISMDFRIKIPNVRHRLGYDGNIVNLGNWYPIACVYENGEFDTHPYYSNGDPFYSECADYDVSITLPNTLSVASSGKMIKNENSNETSTHKGKLKNARDFAMVLGEFKMLGTEVNGVEVNYYYSKDEAPQEALTTAKDALKTYGELFGAYPYETYSVVQTAFLNGGMEYPALVYISDSVSGKMQTEVIAHETAHQWWYGVVGNDQVKYAWLDEGLTEFTTGLFYKHNPSYGVDYDKRIADALSAYVLYYDAFRSDDVDTSMTRTVSEYSSTFEYTYMTYVKGELMFEATKSAIGEAKFMSALKKYYESYKNKIATPDDLIGCFESASGRSMENFFSAWLEGKVVSFAKVTVGE